MTSPLDRWLLRALATVLLACVATPAQHKVVIGAKNFTESAVLAELMAQVLEEHTELTVERRINLGGTMICWSALQAGEIDIYADYTGTGWAVLLQEPGKITDPLRAFFHVRRRCRAEFGVQWLEPFGLNNTYALAMREQRAAELGITRISDLLLHQTRLTAGFSIEFHDRDDGLPGLAAAYGLQFRSARALEHGLAYEALQSGAIDVMDAYSTDGKLLRYRLRVLEDDRRFFPPYHAAPLVRTDTLQRHPEVAPALARLAFAIPDRAAQTLNYLVEAEGMAIADVARAFLEQRQLVPGTRTSAAAARAQLDRYQETAPDASDSPVRPGFFALLSQHRGRLLWLTLEHLALTLIAVLLAALIAIPLGIAITTRPRLRQLALGTAGMLQTIPSLALLAFMIPLLGLDMKAAVAALVLYALLPILRNTYTGITTVSADLIDSARGMGMRPREILIAVQLPLAMRTIMAGIRTATVISVGVATLAAFIGAGGLGEPIVQGLYLNDANLILTGALPAALLAVLVDVSLGRLERHLQPRG